MSRGAPAVCTLTFDTVRLEDLTWSVQDAGFFEPWSEFKIEANFGDYEEEVMRGFVKTREGTPLNRWVRQKVTVICMDESLLLDRQHIRKTWSTEDDPMTDGEIAEEIATENNLGVQAEQGLSNRSLRRTVPLFSSCVIAQRPTAMNCISDKESCISCRLSWMKIRSHPSWSILDRGLTACDFR